MKIFSGLITLIFYSNLYATNPNLGSHDHGIVKLSISVENKNIIIELDSPAVSVLGFEYLPKSPLDSKVFKDAKQLWTKDIFQLIELDKNRYCSIVSATFVQVVDEKETNESQKLIKDLNKKNSGVHSDIQARASLKCLQNPEASSVQLNLFKYFKFIKSIILEVNSTQMKSYKISMTPFKLTI